MFYCYISSLLADLILAHVLYLLINGIMISLNKCIRVCMTTDSTTTHQGIEREESYLLLATAAIIKLQQYSIPAPCTLALSLVMSAVYFQYTIYLWLIMR